MLLVPSSHSCLDSNSLADLVARRYWRSIIEKGTRKMEAWVLDEAFLVECLIWCLMRTKMA